MNSTLWISVAMLTSVIIGVSVLFYLHTFGYGPMFNMTVSATASVLTFLALHRATKR